MSNQYYNISIDEQQRLLLIEVLTKVQKEQPNLFSENSPFELWVECLTDLPLDNEENPIHNLFI